MNDLQFKRLLKKDSYQIFLLGCPASIPLNFWSHPWFIINQKGIVSRWEVFWQPNRCETSWGHLHKNKWPPSQGIEMFLPSGKYFWKSRLSGLIEGGEGSPAHRMAEFIERSPESYPYCYKYSLLGPNSNTYAQWAFDAFPESGFRLRWNSIGMHYPTDMLK